MDWYIRSGAIRPNPTLPSEGNPTIPTWDELVGYLDSDPSLLHIYSLSESKYQTQLLVYRIVYCKGRRNFHMFVYSSCIATGDYISYSGTRLTDYNIVNRDDSHGTYYTLSSSIRHYDTTPKIYPVFGFVELITHSIDPKTLFTILKRRGVNIGTARQEAIDYFNKNVGYLAGVGILHLHLYLASTGMIFGIDNSLCDSVPDQSVQEWQEYENANRENRAVLIENILEAIRLLD